MGLSVVIIGGLIGTFLAATLTQWYYQKHYGSNGLPFRSDRPIITFDLGWGSAQILEITEELRDLNNRARSLERELAEIRLTRMAIERAKAMGEGGQARLRELKQMKNLPRTLNRNIVGGIGRRIHRARTKITSPFKTLLMGREPTHEPDIKLGGEHENELTEEESEEEQELREREHDVEAQLDDLNSESNYLEHLKASESAQMQKTT